MFRQHLVPASLVLTIGLAAAAPALVSAQGAMPTMRAGLWESTMDMSGMKIASQICMDGPARSSMSALRPQGPGGGREQDCSQTDVHPIPDGFAMKTTCTVRGRTTHTSGTVTGDFRNHYKVDMTVAADGAPEQRMVVDSNRVGDCPADMKPGEARTKMNGANGVDIAAAIAAARARAGAGN